MARYPLWLATRGLSTPPVPKTWKAKGLYVWQNAIVGGGQYGITGAVDHNFWMTSVPFPGDEPTPPPPPVTTKEFTITVEYDSKKYAGNARLEKI